MSTGDETLTILLTDLVGSTAQRVRLGEGAAAGLRRELDQIVGRMVGARGGEVIKGTGDGTLAAFRAVGNGLAAALAIQDALARRNRAADEPVALRVGLAVGDVRRREDDIDGLAIVEATRVCDLADGGQILVTDGVRVVAGSPDGCEFVPLGPIELKGLPEPVALWEVVAGARREPAGVAEGREVPFVGRSAERAALRACLDDAELGHPSVALLVADAGMGKSRLAREAAREAARRGFDVCTGHAREQLELPYLPLAGEFFAHLAELAREERAPVPDVIARAGSSAVAPTAVDGSASATTDEQTWVMHAVVQLTLRLTRRRPLLLTVDDLQWADSLTRELLTYLVLEVVDVAAREPVPFVLVATVRPDVSADLERALARVRRESVTREVRIPRLDEHEVTELLVGLGLPRPTRLLAGQLHDLTGGNPLFLCSVAPQLLGAAATGTDEHAAPLGPGELGVPTDLAAAMSARLDALEPDARGLLAVTALAGDPFDVAVVSRATGSDEADARAHLAAAEREGLVVMDGDRARLTHPLVAQVLGAQLAPGDRRAAHARLADALAGRPDAVLERAHHLVAAGDAADAADVLDAGRAAGAQAWAVGAWADAAHAFDAAAEAARHLGADEAVADLLTRAGSAHVRNQDPEPSRARFAAAVQAHEDRGDHDGAALARLEQLRAELVTAEFGAAPDPRPLESLASELGDDGIAARMLATAAQARWVSGDTERAADLADEAVRRGRTAGDRVATVWGLVARAGVGWMDLRLEDARRDLDAALVEARAAGDPWLEGLVQPRLALTLLWMGRLDEADRAARHACANAEQTRDLAEHSLGLAAHVGVAGARGEWGEVEEWARQAWTALRIARYSWTASLVLPALAWARLAQGDAGGAEEALDRWSSLGDGGPSLHEPLAEVMRAVVRSGRAAPAASRRWPRWPVMLGAVQGFAALVELAASGAEGVPVGQVAEALEEAGARGMVLGEGLPVLVARVAGVAASLEGRADDAEAHFVAAAEVATSIGARPELGRTLLDHARHLVERTGEQGHGGPPDRVRAAELAERAAGILREVAMPRDAALAHALARRLRSDAPVA